MEIIIIIQYSLPIIAMIFAFIEAYFDAKEKSIGHALSAAVRVAVAVGFSWYLFLSPYYIAIYSAILLCFFWIVFDPAYNFFRGVSAWYIGKTAKLDRAARYIMRQRAHIDEYGNWKYKDGVDGRSYLAIKLIILFVLCVAFSL